MKISPLLIVSVVIIVVGVALGVCWAVELSSSQNVEFQFGISYFLQTIGLVIFTMGTISLIKTLSSKAQHIALVNPAIMVSLGALIFSQDGSAAIALAILIATGIYFSVKNESEPPAP